MSGNAEQPNPHGHDRLFHDGESAPSPRARELVLVKDGERFVFRCQAGEEAALIQRLRRLVHDPKVNLGWFDAAVLSHQVGQALAQRLEQMRKGA